MNHVTVHVEDRRVGIARDILREAKQGYAAVALGRHGWSPLKDLILGSIAQKVVNHTLRIPVWVVGGQPAPGKILVAMDRSEAAVRTFDCVTGHLGLRSEELLLFHVIRSLDTSRTEGRPSVSQAGWSGWVEKVRREAASCEREIMESVFERHMKRLEETGGDVSRIKTRIRTSGSSRAGSVMEEAEQGGYGTVVVGRRGHSRVEEFLMGRVSSKVLQLARDRAVLVVD